ncbi:TetR/AcrR family transcriptional regulator [Agromyces neolithicus]|uniref:TetR/AcrR family transcriptional regulator n=1 Tax=Agromyces neolithicus TaxID=269420 RepID=A0ABN2M4I1_9MICO
MPDDAPRRNPMRERFRDQVRDEVKDAALAQLADGGPQAISLNAIAKSLAVTGPALYRYFAGRDELLSTLIVDAYVDLRDALAHDADAAPTADRVERVSRLAYAYRNWALAQPHRYELLFKPPLPGYDAHAAPLAEAARSLMGILLGALAERAAPADEAKYTNDEVLEARSGGTQDFQNGVRTWSRLHGFVSLELGGAFAAMGLDADALFDAEVHALAPAVS